MSLPLPEAVHRLSERKIFQPVIFFVFLVTDLIHHIQGVSPFRIYRFKETDRVLDRIEGVHDHLFFNPNLFCDLRDRRFPQVLFHVTFFGIDCLVRNVTKRTADTDTAVVPQIPPDLPYDHWHCISRKLDHQSRVKIINGLHKSDTADLKKIIRIFTAVLKSFDHT